MTLIVSLRIPDGVVIAGDSLATMNGQLGFEGELDVVCPNCNHGHKVKAAINGINFPATTFAYAQKVYPFLGKFGVGTFGAGQLDGKTIYFIVRELEKNLKERSWTTDSVEEAADKIGERAHQLLKKQVENAGGSLDDFSDEWILLGFQIVGYQGKEAATVELHIGKTVKKKVGVGSGCSVSGIDNVVSALWNLTKLNPNEAPVYAVFSLQDAITYAEFLIKTTASHQQFTGVNPSVGGEIDIALVTPFDDFQWIREKSLTAQMRKPEETK